MKTQVCSIVYAFIFFLLILTISSSVGAQSCKPSGKLRGKKPPPGQCNPRMTLNAGMEEGHLNAITSSMQMTHTVVALSTGWFNNQKRCLKNITIHGNGRSVEAMVVDECDSTMGCDEDHDFQPPCPNNIVDASEAVWKALGVPKKDRGNLDIFWSDA
ncbi:hypothetical protein Acr_08g0009390 [Actinidia rufa]|uniref:Ripening-related protein 1 n=1 Tax=Actinidia rufa TaxID=165716 RepID=A0A7J0F1R5_9ERIC|nr:hypothetical protein Acr_08g0009390 [Actinidia rufa]